MGLRLLVLSWWTPKYLIRKELENISQQTTTALKALLPEHSRDEGDIEVKKLPTRLKIQQQREMMAKNHAKLVKMLEDTIGREQAVRLGREALFQVGRNLGRQVRTKLGVGAGPKDLAKAAKILYRVLDIRFRLEWLDDSNATAIIDHCALSSHYSKFTCQVLSATDEGVISGLQPFATMKFKEYMTSGCNRCVASVNFEHMEKGN